MWMAVGVPSLVAAAGNAWLVTGNKKINVWNVSSFASCCYQLVDVCYTLAAAFMVTSCSRTLSLPCSTLRCVVLVYFYLQESIFTSCALAKLGFFFFSEGPCGGHQRIQQLKCCL
jgi:hypothetical protein